MADADEIVTIPARSLSTRTTTPAATDPAQMLRSAISNQQRYDYLFKIILIGDQSVGKTNLTMRFCGQGFSCTYVATIGIDFKVKTIDVRGKRVKLQIWDTAGQERFKTISRIYYRGAQGVMFVFDLTNATSFDNLRTWVSSFEDFSGECSADIRKIIVGNKCDQVPFRKISRTFGDALAVHYRMKYYETSAKTGYNVEETFYSLAEGIMLQQEKRKEEQQMSNSSISQMKQKKRRRSRKHGWAWSKCSIL